MSPRSGKPPLLSIALISGVALAYEILLLQLFSQVYWHHFAFLAIGTALLGVGAAGTLVTVLQNRIVRQPDHYFFLFITAFCLAVLVAFPFAQRLPFNPLEILWSPGQLGWLALLFVVLALPFLSGAACVVLMLRCFAARAGHIYGADLCGAGIGAMAVVVMMAIFSLTDCQRWLVCCAVLAAATAIYARNLPWRKTLSLGCLSLVLFVWWIPESWIAPKANAFKALSSTLRIPGNTVIETRPSPQGEVSLSRHTRTPLRYAPGLSLISTASLPEQRGVFVNGDGAGILLNYKGDIQSLNFLAQSTLALPYALLKKRKPKPKVLLIDGGSGMEIYRAFFFQAANITNVETHSELIKLPKDHADFTGWTWLEEHVSLNNSRPRAFIAANESAFDLILLPLVGSGETSGAHALSSHYSFTREAIEGYWQRLTTEGLIAFNLELRIPPRSALKLFNTAIDTLQTLGLDAAEKHLIVIRDWKTLVLLVSHSPFDKASIEAVRRFCDELAFDTVYFPGINDEDANRFNLVQGTNHYSAIQDLLGPERQDFLARYKFDLQVITDDRPYMFHNFRWSNIREFSGLLNRGGQALVDWSYPLLIANLVLAIFISAVLILLPLRWTKNPDSKQGRFPIGLYFLAIGLAYLFLEIALIEKLSLYLASPIYAAAVVLSGFLVFSGLGSLSQPRLSTYITAKPALFFGLLISVALLTGLVVGHLYRLPLLSNSLALLVVLIIIAPLAFLLGIPFPTAISALNQNNPNNVSWAWAVNGCASVVSPMLATLLSLHYGLSWLVYLGIGLYAVAGVAGSRLLHNVGMAHKTE